MRKLFLVLIFVFIGCGKSSGGAGDTARSNLISENAQDGKDDVEEAVPVEAVPVEAEPVDAPAPVSEALPEAAPVEEENALAIDGSPFLGPKYFIDYPSDWEIKYKFMGSDSLGLTPMESAGDTFRENINVVLENAPADYTRADCIKSTIENMKKMLNDFKIIKQSDIKINNLKCHVIEYSATMGQYQLHNRVYVFMVEQSLYDVTASMLKGDSFKKFNQILENAVKTFKIN
ncbi:MAG: hypothetical protein JXR91_07165 [Deltaproteobacteria bacterium]|nr:hypothetical protein [Deltaproteobacteria bacterium]